MTLNEAKQIFYQHYDELALDITNLYIQELMDQGHKATGKLIASVVSDVQKSLDLIELNMSHIAYGKTVNTGLKASEVPRTIAFIKQLADWIRVKKIAGGLDKSAENIAIRMAKVMWKQGIPTKGSYRFSNNGRRTGWIDHIYNKYSVTWQDRIEVISLNYLENALDSMFAQTAKKSRGFIEFSTN